MRSFGVTGQTRVYGPDLMLTLCASAARTWAESCFCMARAGIRSMLCLANGSPPEVPWPTDRQARSRRPFARFDAGRRCRIMCGRFRDSGAEIVFVGLSTPETGKLDDGAPRPAAGNRPVRRGRGLSIFMRESWRKRRHGCSGGDLEWFYRLTREPRRLWKRYLLITTVFPAALGAPESSRILRYR